jgi:hydrogenase maturation protease
MRDDAFGPYVVRVLDASWEFLPPVALVDAGTPGNDMALHMEGRDALIVVDAVHAAGPPGELRRHAVEEILRVPPPLAMSPHEPGLKEALLRLQFTGRAPREVFLVGAIPGEVETGVGLSAPVRAAVPRAVGEVVAILRSLGIGAKERVPSAVPDIWWEAEGGGSGPPGSAT